MVQISYYSDINLCGYTCSSVKVSYTDCCTNYYITSGLDDEIIYNEVIINLANNPTNSSPKFVSPAPLYVLAGQPLTYPQMAFDPDGDSLVYSLAPVAVAANTTGTYLAGYSGVSPLGPTWAVTINPNTGIIQFNPNPSGNIVIGVIRIKVDEYRNNIYLGSIYRDIQANVITATAVYNNAIPEATISNITGAGLDTTSRTLTAIPNYPVEFDITLTDADPTQTASLESNIGVQFPGASITHLNGTNPAIYHFSWTPQVTNGGELHHLWFKVSDDYCFFTLNSGGRYNIYVNPLSLTAAITNTGACNTTTGAIDLTLNGGYPPHTFSWTNTATTEDINNLGAGGYQVLITEGNGATWLSDTFYINSGLLAANISQTIPTCLSNNGVLTANPTGGTPPYTCSWSNGQVGNSINNLAADGYSVNITDINNCFLHEVNILAPSPNCYATIKGKLFNDLNQNCIQDAGEYGISNQMVKIQAPQIATLTDSVGNYEFMINNVGNFVIEYIPSPAYQNVFVSSCLPYPYLQNAYITALNTTVSNVNFSVKFNKDIAVYVNENAYISGFPHTAMIICKNYTSDNDTALVTYQHDAALLNPIFTPTPTNYNAINRTATWHYNNFFPGTLQNIYVAGTTSSSAILGDTVKSYARISPILGDSLAINNQDTVIKIVVSAYDPNIKEVSPQGETQAGFIAPTTPQLEYIIHFQNTGNYPASFVTIKDTIDTNVLEVYSIEMQLTSHPCTVTIEEEKVFVFTFKNINLPDSTTDEPNSHGFVKFGLNLKPNLPLNTEIQNHAAIYFDFNAPIITNATLNTLHIAPVDTTVDDTTTTTIHTQNSFFASKLRLYPNPFTEITTLSFLNPQNDVYSLLITDLSGKTVQKIENIRGSEMKIAKENKAKGMYIWELKGKYLARGILMVE